MREGHIWRLREIPEPSPPPGSSYSSTGHLLAQLGLRSDSHHVWRGADQPGDCPPEVHPASGAGRGSEDSVREASRGAGAG